MTEHYRYVIKPNPIQWYITNKGQIAIVFTYICSQLATKGSSNNSIECFRFSDECFTIYPRRSCKIFKIFQIIGVMIYCIWQSYCWDFLFMLNKVIAAVVNRISARLSEVR